MTSRRTHTNPPPHSADAEQAVIGGILLDNEAAQNCAGLAPHHFYFADLGRVWSVILALLAANKPADVITVHEHAGVELRYVNDLVNSVLSARNVASYATIVIDKWRARQVALLGQQLCDQAMSGQDVAQAVDSTITALLALQRGHDKREPQVIGALLPQYLDALMARYDNKGDSAAVPTGLHDLDKLASGGMRPGELWVIGARPSMGKTAFALTVLRNASAVSAVLMLTQEDSSTSMVMRQLAAVARINVSNLRAPHLAPDTIWPKITDATQQLQDLRLYIDDQGGLTLADVRRKIQQVAKRDKSMRVVVVDYVQLMQGNGDNRNLELGRIANGLKTAAKEFEITVILLSQLNREADKRHGVPQMADLRDSGDIEGAADVIGLLHRAYMRRQEDDLMHWAQLHVCKHKNGPIGTLSLWFDGETQRFESWDGPVPVGARG